MKKIKLFLLSFTLVAASFVVADAQVYHSAIGARLGWPVSFSYKTFISQKSALEGYVGYRGYSYYNWISVSGAYLYHSPFPDVENLQWYVGGGASMYFWNYDDTFSTPGSNTGASIQGYLGLDYTFDEIPLNLTVDWVPTVFVNGYFSGFGGRYGGVGVRYVLGR